MDIRERWENVKAEAELISEPHVYVVSLNRRDKHIQGGRVVLVKKLMAARLLVDGTHELASEQQIAEFKADQERRSREIRQQQIEENQKFQIHLSPEMIAHALTSVSAPASAPAGKPGKN